MQRKREDRRGRQCPDWLRNTRFILLQVPCLKGMPDGNIFNTSYIFDRQGKQIGKHRKAHLFDINVKGGQYFREQIF